MKPIHETNIMTSKPCSYDGINFDSQGERRWYILLKELNADISRNYKPCFMRYGITYIPDFIINNSDSNVKFIEIKGNMDRDSKMKIEMFSEKHPILVLHSWIPEAQTFDELIEYMKNVPMKNDSYEEYYTIIKNKKELSLFDLFGEKEIMVPCISKTNNFMLFDAAYTHDYSQVDIDKTLTAYSIARKARFND